MITDRPTVRFAELFEAATNRSEVVCTFLALLELIRLKQLACVQSEEFGEIEIRKAEPPAAAANAGEGNPPAEVPAAAEPAAPTTAENAIPPEGENPRQS